MLNHSPHRNDVEMCKSGIPQTLHFAAPPPPTPALSIISPSLELQVFNEPFSLFCPLPSPPPEKKNTEDTSALIGLESH